MRRLSMWAIAIALASCHDHPHDEGDHGHDHGHDEGHGEDHGDDHGHGHAESEVEPISVTRWVDGYELFVEFPPPVPAEEISFIAHVTDLEGFQPAREGGLTVRFRSGDRVVVEMKSDAVKRPGIFIPVGDAPSEGTYALEILYERGGKSVAFDCGEVRVAKEAPEGDEAASDDHGIAFLKETQWQIPFHTAWAEKRKLAREIELPAIIEPAGSDQLTIGAPTGGRFYYAEKKPLAPGVMIEKNEIVGYVVPTVAGDDFSRLILEAEEARLAKEQLERELARIEPLVAEGLLPDKRIVEVKNDLEREVARLRSAQGRIGSVTSQGADGGLPIRAAVAGEVADVFVPNGEPVSGGATIARLRGSGELWLRARFVARPQSELAGAAPSAVRIAGGVRVELPAAAARLLSPTPVIDPTSQIATWVVSVDGDALGERAGDLAVGASAVLLLRVGAPEDVTAVPHSAVVDINTQPFVYVQAGGEEFEKRRVTPGRRDGSFVEIQSGVAPNERVVTQGGYDIHLTSILGTVESHRH